MSSFNPISFLSRFKTEKELVIFLNEMCINDIKELIVEFEVAEMYEVCEIMQGVIDHKVDTMLEGLGFEID